MIDETAHHLKKRRTSPSASSRCSKGLNYGASEQSCNICLPSSSKQQSPIGARIFSNGARSRTKQQLPIAASKESRRISAISILAAVSILLIAPLLVWDAYPTSKEVLLFLRHIELVWTSLLHISIWPVIIITAAITHFITADNSRAMSTTHYGLAAIHRLLTPSKSSTHFYTYKTPLIIAICFTTIISMQSFLQMAFPSIIWNPAIWIPWSYRVYLPREVQSDMEVGCFTATGLDDLEVGDSTSEALYPLLRGTPDNKYHLNEWQLCLSEEQWNNLSSGTLSSNNVEDLTTVHRGLRYLQTLSRGIVINALARNIRESIPELRSNIEGLIPLLGKDTKLSLVVFENDSVDGTREELKRWAEDVNAIKKSRYNVDLIQCPLPNTDCKLNIIDRNDVNAGENKTSSGVGKLADFRQIVLDHIMTFYEDYSHMIVLDVDLGVSMSPFGVVHNFGLMSDNGGSLADESVIASAATQVWPGTLGTVMPPYDLSAFRPKPADSNFRVRALHRKFCQMLPPGDRWRNMCDAVSPMQFFMILQNNDPVFHLGHPYEVQSAFNGATMYPLELIRSRGAIAKYDAGNDGQQCEHIAFHLSIHDRMVVNPKWTMNLKVNKPGGPHGFNVILKVFYSMSKRPNVTRVISAVNFMSFFMFVWAVHLICLAMKERSLT